MCICFRAYKDCLDLRDQKESLVHRFPFYHISIPSNERTVCVLVFAYVLYVLICMLIFLGIFIPVCVLPKVCISVYLSFTLFLLLIISTKSAFSLTVRRFRCSLLNTKLFAFGAHNFIHNLKSCECKICSPHLTPSRGKGRKCFTHSLSGLK